MKNKGANIVGAIFLYQIFDQITQIEEKSVPKQLRGSEGQEMREMKEMKELKEPLINRH